jgi:hypothetical protein
MSSHAAAVEAGEFIGPRIYRPGAQQRISGTRSPRRPREILEFYNTETIKQYMSGDRRTRQLIIMAAREQG